MWERSRKYLFHYIFRSIIEHLKNIFQNIFRNITIHLKIFSFLKKILKLKINFRPTKHNCCVKSNTRSYSRGGARYCVR